MPTVTAAEIPYSLLLGTPCVKRPRAVQAQKPRDDAVARAIGGASANPASKLFLQSLIAWPADRSSSLSALEMAGMEIKEIEAMVPALRSENGAVRTLGVSGSSSRE